MKILLKSFDVNIDEFKVPPSLDPVSKLDSKSLELYFDSFDLIDDLRVMVPVLFIFYNYLYLL